MEILAITTPLECFKFERNSSGLKPLEKFGEKEKMLKTNGF
jgi:hypothetical protein